MTQRRNLNREIVIKEQEAGQHITDSSDEQIEELIAKFLRAIEKLKEINQAS